MYICNIYPIKNQAMYKHEEVAMILAQFVKKGLYKPNNFENCNYIIMDNGLYEGQQVSTKLSDLIQIAVESHLPINEIVIPDVMCNSYETFKLFSFNCRTMDKHPEYSYMYVCHGENPREVATQIRMMNELMSFVNEHRQSKIRVTLAVGKLCDFNRDHPALIEAYTNSRLPIHFLGLKTSFCELEKVKDIIRSCDTCQLSHLIYNDKSVIHEANTIYLLHRDFEEDKTLNLEKVKISYNCLIAGKEKLDEELKRYCKNSRRRM